MGMGPVRPVTAGSLAAGRTRRREGGFALPSDGADSAASVTGAAPPPVLGALLAVQDQAAAPPAEPPAARARHQAAAALDELRGLQLELLRGGQDLARLERLAHLAESGPEGLDPALAALLAEIRLRARVELARRRVAAASSI